MKKYTTFLSCAYLLLILMLTGCSTENKGELTTMAIEDPKRHYYPIVQGQKQAIKIKICNTGNELLKISKILPSCGCTISNLPTMTIAAGKFGTLEMEYDSTKNIGYVGVYTTIVTNTPQHTNTLFFDLNVVPHADYTRDYEELYIQEQNKTPLKELTEKEVKHKGYTVSAL